MLDPTCVSMLDPRCISMLDPTCVSMLDMYVGSICINVEHCMCLEKLDTCINVRHCMCIYWTTHISMLDTTCLPACIYVELRYYNEQNTQGTMWLIHHKERLATPVLTSVPPPQLGGVSGCVENIYLQIYMFLFQEKMFWGYKIYELTTRFGWE